MSERYHYTWQCCPSPEVRGRRHSYQEKACGVHNVHSSKKPITEDHRPQATPCWWCGKRPRLSPSTTEYWYSKEDAVRIAADRNAEIASEQYAEYTTEHSTEGV